MKKLKEYLDRRINELNSENVPLENIIYDKDKYSLKDRKEADRKNTIVKARREELRVIYEFLTNENESTIKKPKWFFCENHERKKDKCQEQCEECWEVQRK